VKKKLQVLVNDDFMFIIFMSYFVFRSLSDAVLKPVLQHECQVHIFVTCCTLDTLFYLFQLLKI
jgi:hypothetical protein